MLGYERTGQFGSLQTQSTSQGESNPGATSQPGSNNEMMKKDATYLNLYLTLEPPLNVPDPVKEKLDCEESEEVIRHCEDWERQLLAKHAMRKMSPLVADTNGHSVLVTRYFKPLKPPHELSVEGSSLESQAEKLAWFVANIPYLPRNAIFPGLQV